LGSHVALALRGRGEDVTVLGRRAYPWLAAKGVRCVRADVCDAAAVRDACVGTDAVFHVAAKVGIWGPRREYQAVNVDGTRNVIDACRAEGVARLIYTSTPSVVFGRMELCGVDESQPYPKTHLTAYAATKAEAEGMVLAVNGPGLATVALRPHLVWGPGDTNLIPRILDRARHGRLVQVGKGENLVDLTYIDNAATAHLNACDALAVGRARGGRAYFISQGEPVPLWDWLRALLAALGVPGIRRSVSFGLAYRMGALLEVVYAAFRLRSEPAMTRFLACQLAESHFFSIDAARRDLGYEPSVSNDEGLRRLVEWYKGVDWIATAGPRRINRRDRADSHGPRMC